jgi:RND family efflux transporter MFP subunit
VDGWVAFVHVEVGHMVALGAPVAHVVNDAAMQIDLGMSQDQVSGIRSGSSAEVRVRAVPGRAFKGKVEYAGPRADDMTKTYPVRVVLPNRSRELKSGMVAEVTVTTASFDDVVAIERDWVMERYGEPAVYVAVDSVAVMRKLELGRVIGDRVVVRSGLEPGDMLITLGLENLSENVRIDVKGGPGAPSAVTDVADTSADTDEEPTSGGDDR